MTLWVVIENQRVTWTAFAIVAMFISKTVEILLISSFITKNAQIIDIWCITLLIREKTVANYALLKCKTFSLKIWVCKIFDKFHVCHKAQLLFRLWAHFSQDFLKLNFRRDFEAEVWSAFCRWCFEEVTKLNLCRYSDARLGQDFEF